MVTFSLYQCKMKLQDINNTSNSKKTKKTRNNANRKLTVKAVSTLLNEIQKHFFKEVKANHLIEYWVHKVLTMLWTHGPLYTIKRLKNIRLLTTRYISGSPILTNDFNIATNKKGIPKILGPLQGLLPQNIENLSDLELNELRFLLTLLNISRIIRGGHSTDPNFDSIISPTPFKITDELKKDIRQAMIQLGLLNIDETSKLKIPKFTNYHGTTKAGPNGQALIGAVEDAFLLKQEYPQLLQDYTVLGGSLEIHDNIDYITSNIDRSMYNNLMEIKPRNTLRRISLINDPEAKVRPVAIFDY